MIGSGLAPLVSFASLISTLALSAPALAEVDFASEPASPVLETCAKADFQSYHRARNAESMIKSSNASFSKPNFGGKYLLLQVPYMMGTDWLILDCETGTFLKEVLGTGNAEFRENSFLIRLVGKEETNWYRFTGAGFVKVEEQKKAEPVAVKEEIGKTAGAPKSVREQYQSLLDAHPARESLAACVPLKFDSYFRAQQAKDQILKTEGSLSVPNFAGSFRLVRIELLFETIWVIADCKTGLFFPEFLSGEAHFSNQSDLLILAKSDKAVQLYRWTEGSFVRRPDPTRMTPSPVENEIFRDAARRVIAALPNPDKKNLIEIKNLRCKNTPDGMKDPCTGESEGEKGAVVGFSISGPKADSIRGLIASYGSSAAEYQIDSVRCSLAKESCVIRSK